MPKWNVKEGSHEYEFAVKSLLICLDRANRFLIMNPKSRGIFAGRKLKKGKRGNSQKLQRL